MKKLFLFFCFFVFLFFCPIPNVQAQLPAQWQTNCAPLQEGQIPTIQYIGCVFLRVINVVMALCAGVGILAFIISGIRFYFSQGDPKGIAQAKLSLTFAILGFVLAIGSYAAIVLIGRLLGITLKPHFFIPLP